ncbi:hypothetical protein NHX12_002809 [Muraenolepis orangiensis]|uniref:Transmembrane protein 168 n=1 Tax=Muraenolepis orangiensis TaxID=630683 RepID=A0A9Q0E1I7_9TELE|nr:hypothetical protein NHX12_002809 [Muraenolepis orangiensis]
MCRLIRYGVSHCLRSARAQLTELRGDVSLRSAVRVVGCLWAVCVAVAVCLGLSVRWETATGPGVSSGGFLFLFVSAPVVLALAGVLYCYFRMERLGLGLVHLCLGFLLGLLCFIDGTALRHRHDAKAQTADYLLVSSVVLRALWALLERVCGSTKYRPAFLTFAESLQLSGFAGASLLVDGGSSSPGVVVLIVALAVVMVSLRMKALLAVPNLVCFAAVTGALFLDSLRVATDPYVLACFFVQLVCDPFFDVYFSGLSVTERWWPFLAGRGARRLAVLPLLLLAEVAHLVLAGQRLSGDLGQWNLMVPAFMVFVVFWSVSHLVFLVTVWGFHTKISDCQRVWVAQGSGVTSLEKVMASKGVRHFCLISQRLVSFTLVTTVMLAALTWQSASSLFISTFLLVLPLESLFHGLFQELGSCLGGTCVGYAVVIPTNYCSPDGQPLLLPPDQVQLRNLRSTGMMSNVQRFFAHHLIKSFGCDYSTSGVSLEALQAKLRAFLELRTADGPRHDTYVVFYSGHTHRSGDWALAGGDTLGLRQLVEMWQEKNAGSCSRLILVLDVDSAVPWAQQVGRLDAHLYVAVQGAALSPAADPELQDGGQLGDFTSRWVRFNCDPGTDVRWSEPGRSVSAVYGVSRHWGDYSLHLPTDSDITKHWRTYFPRFTYPMVQLALCRGELEPLWGCGVCLRYLRRVKLNWFPPAVLDTGQGFKLVRS